MTIKTLKTMLKEADRLFKHKNLPIVFLDTSAVIDICKSAREERIRQKKKTNIPLYELYADHFLMNFAGKYQTLISPLTYSEIIKHYNVKCNGNIKEIRETLHPLIKKFSTDYGRLKEFVFPNIPDDKERYDTYWTTKLCCNGNRKKDLEGFSDVDKEILDNAVLFSKYFSKDDEKTDQVIIVSADEHIFRGADMLNDLGYKDIITLSSRNPK